MNIFNHHTNVDINNRIVCFDIKQLGQQLKKLGMLIVQDAVWGREMCIRDRDIPPPLAGEIAQPGQTVKGEPPKTAVRCTLDGPLPACLLYTSRCV